MEDGRTGGAVKDALRILEQQGHRPDGRCPRVWQGGAEEVY